MGHDKREATRVAGISARWIALLAALVAPVFPQSRGVKLPTEGSTTKNNVWREHKDYALLFATNDYIDYNAWPTLKNPIPDAEALEQVLKDNYGFRTEIVRNPNKDQIVTKLKEYNQRQFGEGDQLLIFFAGHGLYDEVANQGFIVARNSREDDEGRGTYESFDDLRAIINNAHARHILVIVDVCYSGLFDPGVENAGTRGSEMSGMYARTPLPEFFANKVRLTTRKFLTSAEKQSVFDGSPGQHSPFAASLLAALRTYGAPKGYLTLANLMTEVEQTKPGPLLGKWGRDEATSEFFFIAKRLTSGDPNAVNPPGHTGPETEIPAPRGRSAGQQSLASRTSAAKPTRHGYLPPFPKAS